MSPEQAQGHIATFHAFRASLAELEEERGSKKYKLIGGIGYMFILLLVVMQDTVLDAIYSVVFSAGIGLSAALVTAPVGIPLMVLAIAFKFFYLLLIFLCEYTFFKANHAGLGSKIVSMAGVAGLVKLSKAASFLRILELFPYLSVLPLSTISFVLRVFVENKARKHASVQLLLDIAEVSQQYKHLGRRKP